MKITGMRVFVFSCVFGILIALFSGCESPSGFANKTGTQVDLARKNYKVIKSNAVGRSYGFWLLGIIPITTTSYTGAISDLCEKSGLQEGKPQAFVNSAEERSVTYLLLFSITKLTVRADVIEFTE
ncbi:MAG TPA: hypothetical protein DCZ94_12375 [Lentisphaeria bacterium]|nr:MAG: hypothetical protein A2X48_21770 [Lentisphaerae bacterium GWF2_49_21]HBC87744.1 hypothetical protein [Lentisphaeria bacterium]